MDKITIITILLAIPLSVLANLFTPSVKNYIALISRKSTIERIKSLQADLDKLELPAPGIVIYALKLLFAITTCISCGLTVFTLGQLQRVYNLTIGELTIGEAFGSLALI